MAEEAKPEKYAKVEQMGHRTIWGRISEELVAGQLMLKIEAIVNGRFVGETFTNASSLYALTPVTKEIAFANAPKTAGYDETLKLLAPPMGRGIEADEDDDNPDNYAGGDRDPDEAEEACVACGSAIVNGVGCGRTDCPHPTPKDPNTPDMFTAPPPRKVVLTGTDAHNRPVKETIEVPQAFVDIGELVLLRQLANYAFIFKHNPEAATTEKFFLAVELLACTYPSVITEETHAVVGPPPAQPLAMFLPEGTF